MERPGRRCFDSNRRRAIPGYDPRAPLSAFWRTLSGCDENLSFPHSLPIDYLVSIIEYRLGPSATYIHQERVRIMSSARHPRPPELEGVSLQEIADRYVARFRDRKADWAAFEDAKIEGFKRAQHRFIGAGGSGKYGDSTVIPPRGFTLSVMYVPPGQGNAAHTHEVEEVFFVLEGYLNVFLEDEDGNRVECRLGKWEGISCPPGVIHGYINDSLEPVYFQVMLGRAQPETMGYADADLYKRRAAHLSEADTETA